MPSCRDDAGNTEGLGKVPGSPTVRTGSDSDVGHEPFRVNNKTCNGAGSAVFTGRACPMREEKGHVDAAPTLS